MNRYLDLIMLILGGFFAVLGLFWLVELPENNDQISLLKQEITELRAQVQPCQAEREAEQSTAAPLPPPEFPKYIKKSKDDFGIEKILFN